MKKNLTVFISAAILLSAAGIYYFSHRTTLYNENGGTRQVFSPIASQYTDNGWYTEPVITMYAPEGRTLCIYKSEISDYEAAGWYTEPVNLLYAPGSKEIYVKQSETEDYLNNGWYAEPVTTMYDKEGYELYIVKSEVDRYAADGWSFEPPTRESLYDLKDSIVEYLGTRSGSWGTYVKSMKTNEYLSVNEKPYSSASLIKLFTMAAVFTEINNGSLTYTDSVKSDLNLMITESSNSACNSLTRRIGSGNTINGFGIENRIIDSMDCKNTQHTSELVTEGGGRAIFLDYNKTSPADCGKVLERIYKGTLVSAEASSQMLDLLKHQTRTWKIPDSLPDDVVTANKTGENNNVQGDAAIVYSPECDYIICVIGNGNVGTGVDTIQEVSRMTYRYFNNPE